MVYAYGLRESIWNGFLKDADPLGFENVKSDEFLKAVVATFWERYGGKTYEGLKPKLAIYAAGVEEAATEVKPMTSGTSITLMFLERKETRSSSLFSLKKARKVGTAALYLLWLFSEARSQRYSFSRQQCAASAL